MEVINISIWYRKRKLIIIIVSILILVISLTIFLWNKNESKEEKNDIEEVSLVKEEKPKEQEFKVDIKGEIKLPGIYSLKEGSRVIDVIDSAGGLTKNADTSVINLSKKIEDEMVIIIYSKKEVSNFKRTKELEQEVQNQCIQKDTESLKNDACIEDNKKVEENTKVNINTASQEELMTLPGIGEAKAKDIIKYREKKKFEKIEDIKEVSGIGDSLFAKIKENITV